MPRISHRHLAVVVATISSLVFVSVQPESASAATSSLDVRVAANWDDAEEKADGSVNTGSSDLELVFDGSLQTVGIRFADVAIPFGATITAAHVQFTADETTSGSTDLIIQGQAGGAAAPFESTPGNISGRARTAAGVPWAPPTWSSVGASGSDQRTPDLTNILQEVVAEPGWLSGMAVVLLITGSGERVAEAHNGNPAAAPLLHIEFEQQPVMISIPVSSASDDAEEAASGEVLLGSTDLDLVEALSPQTVGIRFQNVAIPPAAVVTNAYVQFTADEVDTAPTLLQIAAQASDDAAAFTSALRDLTSRSRTAAVATWAPAPWTVVGEAGPDQRTPDLTAVIQEVIARPGWSFDNALALLVTGSGARTAESFDADPSDAPVLVVEFSAGGDGPPVGVSLIGAGDIARCGTLDDEATAELLDLDPGATVFTLGDNVYPDGSAQEFSDCYDPSWGRHKDRTKPAAGNHDYLTADAAGYFGYFGAAAGDDGWYSYDLGTWHVVVLNSNCSEAGGCGAASPQVQWLEADLAANPAQCIIAYWHHPRFSSGSRGDSDKYQPFWDALFAYGGDVVMVGHDHHYERQAKQTPAGVLDPVAGIRQFIVGTGGATLSTLTTPFSPNTEARQASTHGVLRLQLNEASYDWEYLPVAGESFTDSGSAACVDPANSAPVVNIAAPISGSSVDAGEPVTFAASAVDVEDGPITSSISWTSDRDGPIGTGGTFVRTDLSVGSHLITAGVVDSQGAAGSAVTTITVVNSNATAIDIPIVASHDDAEEQAGGLVKLGSSDLELVFDRSDQTVGLRFADVALPAGATITDAFVQFTADETTSAATSLQIRGQAADDPPKFTSSGFNITTRSVTAASAVWAPVPWTVGEAGPAQRSSTLVAIVQELVDRPGWNAGNAIVLLITGTGERVAESSTGSGPGPVLHVEFTVGG